MTTRLILFLWLAGTFALPIFAHDAGPEMAAAASRFLASLPTDAAAKASFPLKDDERRNWHFVPKDRKGLPLKEMKPEQRAAALALLQSGLSHNGYAKASNIMSLESILHEMEGANRRFPRESDLYYVSIFGKPDPKGTWGWRFEGHHLALNFTVVAGHVAGTPSFLGSNPAEIRRGPAKGLRVLAEEEDLARKLVKSLNDEQRGKAIYSETAPADIITAAKQKVEPLDKVGVAAGQLTSEQSKMLTDLISAYINRCRPDVAKVDMQKIRDAGLEKVLFAWAGSTEPNKGHYYRVQGPTFLLEYDNTQNDANHIHAVWRDFEGDFGEDLLRKHYRETPH